MLNKSGIPIIVFHVGDKTWTDIALRQATLAAPESDVILLNEEVRALPFGIHQVVLNDYRAGADEFRKAYVHLSVNRKDFEFVCYWRWFIIRDFVRRHGIARFCVFDSDIMLFAPVETFAAEFEGYDAGNWAWANYFAAPEPLEAMCGFFLDVYRDPNVREAMAAKHGGFMGKPHLADMRLLYELAGSRPGFLDQSDFPLRGYDSNIRVNEQDAFVMNGPIKHLTITDGVPVARTKNGAAVPFRFLHFQGHAKMLMADAAWTDAKPARESRLLQAPAALESFYPTV